MGLLTRIQKQISEQGDISFVDYMHQVLYTPNLGYYSSGHAQLGVSGDFVTAPLLTPLFGQTVANQCQQLLANLANPIIFEFGAGTGELCVDLLQYLEHLASLPVAYHILEVSAHLQQRQQALVQQKIPHLAHRVHWLTTWPSEPFEGILLANEVLDAMPVHRFMLTETGLLESFITLNQQGALIETYKPCSDTRLVAHVASLLPKDCYPYQSEANLFLDDWLAQCSKCLQRGALLILDYGFPRHEYYHPDRCQGTLMCHYRHQAHVDPLAHPGEEDITAHVDFTHVAEAATRCGFHVAGYTNQAAFLLANGLLNLLSEVPEGPARIKQQQAVKILLQPSEMGELFKVIALTKRLEIPLTGFQLQDKRASL